MILIKKYTVKHHLLLFVFWDKTDITNHYIQHYSIVRRIFYLIYWSVLLKFFKDCSLFMQVKCTVIVPVGIVSMTQQ